MANEQILIVEDECAVAHGLRYDLQQEGFTVLRAETGHSALDLARTQQPQLFLFVQLCAPRFQFPLRRRLKPGHRRTLTRVRPQCRSRLVR
ncbi:MAG: hypothetical protein R2932_30100 [Caldilineaceae bacterium]